MFILHDVNTVLINVHNLVFILHDVNTVLINDPILVFILHDVNRVLINVPNLVFILHDVNTFLINVPNLVFILHDVNTVPLMSLTWFLSFMMSIQSWSMYPAITAQDITTNEFLNNQEVKEEIRNVLRLNHITKVTPWDWIWLIWTAQRWFKIWISDFYLNLLLLVQIWTSSCKFKFIKFGLMNNY